MPDEENNDVENVALSLFKLINNEDHRFVNQFIEDYDVFMNLKITKT